MRGEETVPQRPRSSVRKDAQEMGREQEFNAWVYEANRGSSWPESRGSSAILRPERFRGKKRWGTRRNASISEDPWQFHVGAETHLSIPDFLSRCLCALAHKQGWFQGTRWQEIVKDKRFGTFYNTWKHAGKENKPEKKHQAWVRDCFSSFQTRIFFFLI